MTLDAALGLARRRLGLPVDGGAKRGALEDLQRQQRALHPRRRDLDAEQVEDVLAVELEQLVDRHALDLVGGHRRRRLADRATVAGEAQILDAALVVGAQLDAQLVAAERVGVLEGQVVRVEVAPVVRPLVVLEDLLAVDRVHAHAKILLTSPSPSTSASTSARVLWTANEARVVAATPKRCISGCAQWWPARTQTPLSPRISAMSCGCAMSSVNATSAPWRSASLGPMTVTSGSSARRSSAYAARSRSCSRMFSIPIEWTKSMAAPRPIASAMFDVPASNFAGS